MASRSHQPLKGIALKLAAVALFVAMQALVRIAAEAGVPAGQSVFFRSFFSIPVILVWLAAAGRLRTGLRVVSVPGHVARGAFGVTAMGLRFTGLALLPFYEVQAIGYATPLFVVILAVLFAGERVRIVRLAAVAMGLVGVLIVLWPRLGEAERDAAAALGALAVLGSAAFAATAQTFIRRMVEHEETSAIVFWFAVTGTVLSLLTLPFGWVVPSAGIAALLVGAGLMGGVGQICLTSAYRFADAGVVAPFDYASLLIALGIGIALFGEVPEPRALAGAALVVAGGVLIVLRERRLGIERSRARAAKGEGHGA